MRDGREHRDDSTRDRTAVGVLVVDDDPVFLSLARDLIRATPGFDAVGEAANGEDGVSLATALRPELVLMDVRMPGIGGIEAARRIAEDGQDRVVVVLMSADPGAVAPEAMPTGTIGPVGKERLRPSALRRLWDRWASAP
jgi:two-component system, NarL family, invasion response regulator UvrY